MTENPYASPFTEPVTSADSPVSPDELRIATRGQRFLNMIVDGIIMQVLSWVAGFVVGVVYVAMRLASSDNSTLTRDDEAYLQLAGFLVGILSSLAYWVITEALFQRTLAKFLTGTRVVTSHGQRPSFGQILGRSLARLIPFEAFSFLGKENPVGWHDSLSGTRVIKTR